MGSPKNGKERKWNGEDFVNSLNAKSMGLGEKRERKKNGFRKKVRGW